MTSLNNQAIHHASLATFCAQLNTATHGESDFSDVGVALYTSDASNYRQIPLGVIYPESVDQIVAVTRLCDEHNLPVLMRGGGTSQNGQCVNRAVILDCSRHLRNIISIDVENRSALVEPGIVCDVLKESAEKHGLTFGPDPATHSRCTLGGMIGNNSCGPHSMLAGKTVENVLELEVLTTDGARFWVGPTSDDELAEIIQRNDRRGQIYRELKSIRDEYATLIQQRFPTIKRRVSGYNLDQLLPENDFNVARALVGSEGTCVTILQARVRLIENPAVKRLVVLGFEDIYIAGDTVPEILPYKPIAMEGLDWAIIGGLIDRNLKLAEVALLPEGRAWLMVELAAEDDQSLDVACTKFVTVMQASKRVLSVLPVEDAVTVAKIWSIREQGASATSISLDPNGPDPVVGWEDTAVDPLQLGDYLREFQALVDRYNYQTSLYGHFGDGCIHARITFDTRSHDGVAHWRKFSEEIATLVIKYGGSLSGEHGDGQSKAEFLPLMYGPELMEAFKRFKSVWDPDNRMNPGKLINAYRMDENLRFGPDYSTPSVTTTLKFVEDPGGFGRTTERCIGMGRCRSHSGAMCPSYQATFEERFSTRGRAHLLHELLRGDIIRDGWQNKDIADSLEHCLSCKACKSECPTKVDIASYKAEFMEKHYAGRRRPLSHHVFGRIGSWLPHMAKVPRLINALQRSPASAFAKRFLDISEDKKLPQLAPESFNQWVSANGDAGDDHFVWFGDQQLPPVILWTDSFNGHYRPAILRSALNVLTRAGFRVGVARQHFCCGRPLYEHGLLEQAKKQLEDILNGFHSHLPEGSKLLVLEPSCLSVFRDELLRLCSDDKRAENLSSRTLTVTDFLTEQEINPSSKLSSAIMHLHCHHKSLSTSEHERQWMHKCFDTVSEPESGCCGMAGSFGMKSKTRYIAQTLFKRNLQPAIGDAAQDTVIVSNGFSCREHIEENTGREVLHPIEVIERCL